MQLCYAGLSCHWSRRLFFCFFFRLVVRTHWSLGRQGRNAYAFNGTGVFGGASGGCAVVGNGGNNTSTRPNLPVRSAGHTCSSPQLICRQISRFGGSRPPGPPDKCSVVTSCLRVRREMGDGVCLTAAARVVKITWTRNATEQKKLGKGEWIFYTRGYRCDACLQLLNLKITCLLNSLHARTTAGNKQLQEWTSKL
jgi:hypothetical protein